MKISSIVLAVVVAGLLLSTLACKGKSSKKAENDTVTYDAHIKKLTVNLCRDCHGPKSPTLKEFKADKKAFKKKGKGPRMDTYDNLMIFVTTPDTGALMRRLDDGTNTKDGKPGNMYENLGDTSFGRGIEHA